jgi:Tat protein translocase TatB subunit
MVGGVGMFNMGIQELLVILVIALIVVGPNKLPDLAKALGRGLGELRRATSEIKETLEQDETVKELKNDFETAQRGVTLDNLESFTAALSVAAEAATTAAPATAPADSRPLPAETEGGAAKGGDHIPSSQQQQNVVAGK